MIAAVLGLALLAAPVKHSATLRWNWTQGSKGSVLGFYVMRSSFFHHSGRIGTVSASGRTFIDNTVAAGQKYTYGVIAFNRGGQAPISNQVTVTIPK